MESSQNICGLRGTGAVFFQYFSSPPSITFYQCSVPLVLSAGIGRSTTLFLLSLLLLEKLRVIVTFRIKRIMVGISVTLRAGRLRSKPNDFTAYFLFVHKS